MRRRGKVGGPTLSRQLTAAASHRVARRGHPCSPVMAGSVWCVQVAGNGQPAITDFQPSRSAWRASTACGAYGSAAYGPSNPRACTAFEHMQLRGCCLRCLLMRGAASSAAWREKPQAGGPLCSRKAFQLTLHSLTTWIAHQYPQAVLSCELPNFPVRQTVGMMAGR